MSQLLTYCGAFIQLCARYFIQTDTVRHSIESFAEVQDYIHWLLEINWVGYPIAEGRLV